MASQAIDTSKSTESYGDYCLPKKYLAITLLVLAIVCVAVSLLCHFHFKASGYTIGFGCGAGVALIACGFFANGTLRDEPEIPSEIKELDLCETPTEAREKFISFLSQWTQEEHLTNDAIWKERYKIAEHYWDRFGKDTMLLYEVPNGKPQSRWGIMHSFLNFGAQVESSRYLEHYFAQLEVDYYSGAKGGLAHFKPNETVLIQTLKICRRKAQEWNGRLGSYEKDWCAVLAEYVRLAGKSKKGAEFVTQNKLPDSLRKILSP